MDLGTTYQIKVPAALAEVAVKKRTVNGKYAVKTGKGYVVATDLHYLAFFCILKAYSPNTSQISYWTDELDYLMSITNLSRRAIYKYINKLKEMELIVVSKDPMDRRRKISEFTLLSWDKLAKKYDLPGFDKYIEITYDKDNSDHHPKYLIIQAEIIHNQDKQAYMINKKVKRFKQNYAQENKVKNCGHKKPTTTTANDRKAAEEISFLWANTFRSFTLEQCESESEQATFLSFVSKLNPSINRGLSGFLRSYNFTDLHRSIYLKKQLVKRGFGEFKQNIKVYSQVENRAPKYLVTLPDGTAKTKQMKPVYNRFTKCPGTWLTDQYKPSQKTAAA